MIRDPDATVTRLTHDVYMDRMDRLNGSGQLAWVRWTWTGCQSAGRDVMFYDRQTIRQITFNDLDNDFVKLTDAGQIIRAETDWCVGGPSDWQALIKLDDGQDVVQLSEPNLPQPSGPTINSNGVCACGYQDSDSGLGRIQIWDEGVVTTLTDWGEGPQLNDRGDLTFIRRHESTRTWQVWLHTNQVFHQITDDPVVWSANSEINNEMELCWQFANFPNSEIFHMRRFALADLNCDGVIDAFDIEPFVVALFEPGSYQSHYPACDHLLADVNGDGSVNAFDIEPFIDLLFP